MDDPLQAYYHRSPSDATKKLTDFQAAYTRLYAQGYIDKDYKIQIVPPIQPNLKYRRGFGWIQEV